jgi:hypothetical protein
MTKTAIQIAIKNIGQCLNSEDVEAMLGELLEVEKQQIIDFHIEVMKKGLEYENEKEWSDEYLPLIKKRAEIYYNETFKSE